MEEFKYGDKVKIGSSIFTYVGKHPNESSKSVVVNIWGSSYVFTTDSLNLVESNLPVEKFEYNDKIEVYVESQKKWDKRFFGCINPINGSYITIHQDGNIRTVKDLSTVRKDVIITLTRQEIADKFNLPVDKIEII